MNDFEDAGTLLPYESDKRSELPILDFSRLAKLHEEFPLHHQHKMHVQQLPMHYSGQASPPAQPNKRMRRLRFARLAHLDSSTKARVSRSVQTAQVKSWLHAHGYVVKAEKLHPAVARVIEEWFQLVDEDNSRTLEHHELLAALKEAQIPCDDATINEMISLMDVNKDGVIDWEEFEVFMTEEFAAGKSLLSGEYLLPSGTSLNFGVMIGKLKRNRLLHDIMDDPNRRNRWAAIANNPDALGRELATMQEAAEVTSLTLEHLKRSEGRRVASNNPRTQLTTALIRTMDEGRNVPKTLEPGRNLAEKLRCGMSRRSCDMPQCDVGTPDSPNGQGHTPRGACPDPTTLPLTPNGSEGAFSACSSADTLMQVHLQAKRNHHNAPGGAAAAIDDGTTPLEAPCVSAGGGGFGGTGQHRSATQGFGCKSAAPQSAETVARYSASQQLCQSTTAPPTSLPQPQSQMSLGNVASLARWAEYEPRASEQHNKAPGSDMFAANTCLSTAATLPQPRKNDGTANAGWSGLMTSSSAPCPDAASAHGNTMYQSPNRHAAGPSRRGNGTATADGCRSVSPGHAPGPALVPHRPRNSVLQLASTPHYLVASTASSRAHIRPASRVISQVGLMAKELRGTPGRYFVEAPGLPPAVLTATRGQWSNTVAIAASTASGVEGGRMRDSGDGFGTGSQTASTSGGSTTTASNTASSATGAGAGGSATTSCHLADLRPASSPPQPFLQTQQSHGNGCGTLPFLTQAVHLSELQDVIIGDDTEASSTGGTVIVSQNARGMVIADGGSITGENPAAIATASPPDAALRAPIRSLATAAWEGPAPLQPLMASPRPQTASLPGDLAPACTDGSSSSRARTSRLKLQGSADSDAVGADIPTVNTVATALPAPQPSGLHDGPLPGAVGSGGVGAITAAASTGASKALKPTSIMMRISPGFPPYADVNTSRYSATGDVDVTTINGGGGKSDKTPRSHRRFSHGGPRRGSGGSGGTRESTGDGAPSVMHNSHVFGPNTQSHRVSVGAEGGVDALAPLMPPSAGTTARYWHFRSDDGESLYGGENKYGIDDRGHVWSLRRQSPHKGALLKGSDDNGAGRARTKARGRTRASRSGDGGDGPTSVAAARQRREAVSASAVATALLDALPLSSNTERVGFPGNNGALVSGAASARDSELGSGRSRSGGGGGSQPTDAGSSGTGRTGGSNIPGRASLALLGPPEGRPPSRARTPLNTRGDREDFIDSSWRAATASLLQLQLTHQLNDPCG
ncbi:hypothetical protein VaNZ11_002684 [Volvox africanus]|uniref:EF-hand domain-containing protein n=1 Tax=Volvox africanus TaxID=51714 RepID=A0ABQ5RSJ5_9CHLO|nr:hypothetical protein VaNZ11_002684 [Volvox africanus]